LRKFQEPNGLRYLRVGGRGQCLGAGKTRSEKNAPKSRRLPHVRCTREDGERSFYTGGRRVTSWERCVGRSATSTHARHQITSNSRQTPVLL